MKTSSQYNNCPRLYFLSLNSYYVYLAFLALCSIRIHGLVIRKEVFCVVTSPSAHLFGLVLQAISALTWRNTNANSRLRIITIKQLHNNLFLGKSSDQVTFVSSGIYYSDEKLFNRIAADYINSYSSSALIYIEKGPFNYLYFDYIGILADIGFANNHDNCAFPADLHKFPSICPLILRRLGRSLELARRTYKYFYIVDILLVIRCSTSRTFSHPISNIISNYLVRSLNKINSALTSMLRTRESTQLDSFNDSECQPSPTDATQVESINVVWFSQVESDVNNILFNPMNFSLEDFISLLAQVSIRSHRINLVIREHPTRKTTQWNLVKRSERLSIVVDNITSSTTLIMQAHICATVNSTIIGDCLLANKPVISYGRSYYDCIMGVCKPSGLTDLEAILANSIRNNNLSTQSTVKFSDFLQDWRESGLLTQVHSQMPVNYEELKTMYNGIKSAVSYCHESKES